MCSIGQELDLAFKYAEMWTIQEELYPHTCSMYLCKKVSDVKWLWTRVVWFFQLSQSVKLDHCKGVGGTVTNCCLKLLPNFSDYNLRYEVKEATWLREKMSQKK